MLSLAIAGPAPAGAEVPPVSEHLGGPLATPLVEPVPTVTVVSPAIGPAAGGTKVTITGTGLTGATEVKFGSTAGTVSKVSETSIEAVSPAGSGKVSVTVKTGGGTSAPSGAADEFTYAPVPTVTGVSPNSGPVVGGTKVTITGTGLTGATEVKFGSTAGTVSKVSETSIEAVSPAGSGAGKVHVTVTTPGGTSATGAADEFSYVPAPAVTGVSPNIGPADGGTKVTITGANLTGATAVKFGSTAGTVSKVSETSIEATSPAGTGKVHVTVTTAGGTSAAMSPDEFTYAPTVTAISPTSGPVAGGTAVKITGTGFVAGSTVTIGGAAATEVAVKSESEITARTPAGGVGEKAVVVTDAGGPSTGGTKFTYLEAPIITSITPSTGPPTGGTSVTIHGSGYLAGVQNVKFGATVAPGAPVVNSEGTSITVTSPPGTGTVNVTVTTLNGISALSSADEFTYATSVVTPEGGTTTTTGGGGGGGGTTNTGPPPPPPTALPAPVLGRSANVVTVAGRASVRLPGARSFVSLSSARQIPYGAVIEATRGEVSVTAAKPGGGTQRGQFFDGEFVLSQGMSGRVLATLAGGNFAVCRPQAGTARAKSKPRGKFAASTHLVRRLWAEAHGNFATKARYAGSIVAGAQWLTEDMCEGSLVLATREHVEVTDLVRHRSRVLGTGGIYVSKAG